MPEPLNDVTATIRPRLMKILRHRDVLKWPRELASIGATR